MFPEADSVSEVRISANSNNAEFAQAGEITITSKSGGNQIHGAAYWCHHNGAFEALRFRAQWVINVTVPPIGLRTGNFSCLLAANQLRDPLASNAPLAGNIIPANRISSTSTALLRGSVPELDECG